MTTPHAASSSPPPGLGSFSDAAIDDLLLARARKGDESAFEKLYRTFELPVYALARRLCRSSHDAEEVTQETFLELARSLRGFRGDGSFAGWVRRIATTKALMRLRSSRSRGDEEELPHDLPDREDPASQREAAATAARVDLEGALALLTDNARAVIWLHEVEGYSHDEIGHLMGRSASFSKSQLARGYARLRACLAPPAREEACT